VGGEGTDNEDKITAGFVQLEGEQREEESNLMNSAWNEKGVKERESPWAL
jgi:hypothetical protein